MPTDRTVFVLLPGRKEENDDYQLLQSETALAAGRRHGLRTEVSWAPAFDQLRALKKRLLEPTPVDAVVVEPASLSTMGLLLRELRGRSGLVLLNAWSPAIEEASRSWDRASPFGTVSTDHAAIGRVQGEQVLRLARGGPVLCVTGPRRSSAAQERLEALRATVGGEVDLVDTEAGEWTEAAGIMAFGDWYRVFKSRNPVARRRRRAERRAGGGRGKRHPRARRRRRTGRRSPGRSSSASTRARATGGASWTTAPSPRASSRRPTRGSLSSCCTASGRRAGRSRCAPSPRPARILRRDPVATSPPEASCSPSDSC